MRISDWSSDVCSSDLLRAIELDQLAAAVPAVTRLIGPWAASIAVLPESFLDHPLAQRLVRNGDLVPLGQILDRQGRTEIMVVLADKAENLIAQLRLDRKRTRLNSSH